MSEESDDNDPLLGRVIDSRFTIQSVLGRGGMGVVYKAHQASLERAVALKIMTGVPPEREAEFQRRFFLEAATAAKLKHPNTITVFDYGSSVIDGDRVFFIAMELLDGVPLQKLVTKGRALAPLRAVHIALQIARSLREAHKAGVVHRDLKPGNVMLVKSDEADDVEGDFVKVLDFGLAKVGTHDNVRPIEGLTKAGTFMGSPRYVAPEQVEGRPVDARADIYSLGCILYRMLTGRVPFDGKQPVEIMLKHLHEDPPPLGVNGLPLSLDKLIVKEMLAKDPGDRPDTLDIVMQRLKLIRAELGGTGSGIMVVSDERFSHPPSAAVELSDPPIAVVNPLADDDDADDDPNVDGSDAPTEDSVHRTRLDRRPSTPPMRANPPSSALSPMSFPSVPSPLQPPSHERSDVGRVAKPRSGPSLDGDVDMREISEIASALTHDDSTRPTRVLGKLSVVKRPPKKPWGAIAAGVALGLAICFGAFAWRLGYIDVWMARARPVLEAHGVIDAPAPAHASSTAPSLVPAGPLAKHARIRVTSDPPGADVLEVQGGLPRLLGATPITVEWDVEPKARELLVRKDGFKPSVATIPPPAAGGSEPVYLDVEAVLRAR